MLGLILIFTLLLFPTGRLPSARWRPVAVLGAAGIAVVAVLSALQPTLRLQVERQQLKWFTLAAALLAAVQLVTTFPVPEGELGDLLFGLSVAMVPVAAGIAILRHRLYDVDRRFNRARYDAARTIEAFSVRLRDQVDLDTLTAELLAGVDQTMEPTRLSLWLRPPLPRP